MKGVSVSHAELDWQERGACRSASLELFYSDAEEHTRRALALCERCEVQAACLDFAMQHREHYGVWGGTTERERRRIFRRERRSRRRVDPTAA
jgi:WhiB family transcriptional regulator, redox-sensing transcriptional regulator